MPGELSPQCKRVCGLERHIVLLFPASSKETNLKKQYERNVLPQISLKCHFNRIFLFLSNFVRTSTKYCLVFSYLPGINGVNG